MPDTAPESVSDLIARPEPRQARARARRETILETAMELLAENEPADITTTVIAARAGVPVGSVYRYFPNKFSILSELARRSLDRDDDRLELLIGAALDTGGPLDLEALVDVTVDVVLEMGVAEPGMRRLSRAINELPELRPLLRASNDRMIPVIAKALRSVRPDLGPMRVEAVARTAVEAYTQLGNRAVETGGTPLFPILIEEWKRLMLGYFRAVLDHEALPAE